MTSAECCEFDKNNRPITSEDIIQGGRTYSGCLLLLAARSGLWRRIEIRVLQQQLHSSSEAFYFEYIRTKLCFRRSN